MRFDLATAAHSVDDLQHPRSFTPQEIAMSAALSVALVLSLATLFYYLAVGIVRRHDVKSLDDFMLYGRMLSGDHFKGSFVATSISLATVMFFFFDFTGQFGIALILSPLMYALGTWVFLKILPIIDEVGYLRNGSTLHNFLWIQFRSHGIRKVAAGISIVGYLGLVIIELHVGVTIFSIFSPHPYWKWIVVLVFLMLVGIYTLLGGYRAVVDTDVVQLRLIKWGVALALVALIVLNLKNPAKHDIFTYSMLAPFPWLLPLPFIVAMVVGNVPFQILRMNNWLAAVAVRDLATIQQSLKGSIRTTFFYWCIFAVMGLLIYRLADIQPGQGTLKLFELLLNANEPILEIVVFPIFFVACLAAMISTADSVFHSVIATWIYDVGYWEAIHDQDTGALLQLDDSNQQRILASCRWVTLILLLVAAAIYGVLTQGLSFEFVDLLFIFFNQQLVLFPVVYLALRAAKYPQIREQVQELGVISIIGMLLGLVAAWGCAIWGAHINNPNLAFLSSGVAFGVSCILIFMRAPHLILGRPL